MAAAAVAVAMANEIKSEVKRSHIDMGCLPFGGRKNNRIQYGARMWCDTEFSYATRLQFHNSIFIATQWWCLTSFFMCILCKSQRFHSHFSLSLSLSGFASIHYYILNDFYLLLRNDTRNDKKHAFFGSSVVSVSNRIGCLGMVTADCEKSAHKT